MVTYAERPWLKHYDPGIPHSLQPYPNTTLHELVREAARKFPNNPALVSSAHLPVVGRVASNVTYAELDQQTDALAAALVAFGVKVGDRVALVMPNVAQFVIAYFAVLKAGGVVSAVNPTYPSERMLAQFNDSNVEVVITLSLFYKTVNEVRAKSSIRTVIVTNVKEYLPTPASILFTLAKERKGGHRVEALEQGDHWWGDVLKQYAGQKPSVNVTGDNLALFQYTGGTTGIPKAAVSQHKALVANTLMCRAVLLGACNADDGQNEVFLGAIPFFHVYGIITVVSFAATLGARILLVPNARDIPDLIDVISAFKPTIFMGVPALYNAVNNHPLVTSGKVSLQSIRVCMSGSAPLSPVTKREFERLSGGKLLEGYGMSEAPTASHCNPQINENRAGSIGLPMPDVECRVVSLEDEVTDVPLGEVGELVMHAPNLMIGYHDKPEETAKTLREHDGKKWLYTGDIARMDEDGYFYIVDRKKDMAIIGGYNVYPSNVERIMVECAGVAEVAVAAIPHPTKVGQEALKAWIVRKPGQMVTETDLMAHCEKYLTRYEIPTRYAFVDTLPKTTVGKTLRRELVRMEQESQANERTMEAGEPEPT